MGGLAAGGVIYDPPERDAAEGLAPRGRPAFRLSFDADVQLAHGGRRIDIVSSMSGPDLDRSAWPDGEDSGVLEAVGVASNHGIVAPRLAVAGDAMADRPRTMLAAIQSGLRAGRLATDPSA
jgi:glycerol-3-phosphate dehydrogenase subunit B